MRISSLVSGRAALGALALFVSACLGRVGEPGGDPAGERPPVADLRGTEPPMAGARRLTRVEYRQAIADLISPDAPVDTERLPTDEADPYDNDYHEQVPSLVHVEGADALAESIAAWLSTQPDVRDRVIGCAPSGPDDPACMREFVSAFGRRALRRPLTAEEIAELAALSSFALEEGDFYAGAFVALRVLLSHPEFLYRIEIGTPTATDGVYALTDFELATRLAYALTGSMPDDELLDAAEAGALRDAAQLRAQAERLLAGDAARAHLARFHAMWLGYEMYTSAEGELLPDMRQESSALVERVVFDGAPYSEILTIDRTWVTPELAAHYGFDAPDAGAWVMYPDEGRRGILSHAAVLASGSKAGDTSPTRRGMFILEQLLCREVAPPPPDVNVDAAPEDPDACKPEQLAQHRSSPTCAGCHASIDPIGFGLERYDLEGLYREVEPGRPECEIEGVGELPGQGSFSGPAELGRRVLASGEFEGCVAEQLYRFAVGRSLDPSDERLVVRMEQALRDAESFADMILELVTSDAFRYGRREPGGG
jgi:hypothetical protein